MNSLVTAAALGVVSGLRSLTGLATVAWAARDGGLDVPGWAGKALGSPWCRWVASALAAGELVGDKLPVTPARTAPLPFAGRILIGGTCGAAVAAADGRAVIGGAVGAAGAVGGTVGGYHARAALAKAFGKDLPAAVVEDAVTVGAAALILWQLRRPVATRAGETAVVRRTAVAVT